MNYGSVNKPRGVSARPVGNGKKITKLARVHGSDNVPRTKFSLKKARSTEQAVLSPKKKSAPKIAAKPVAKVAPKPVAKPKSAMKRFVKAKTVSWGGKAPSWGKTRTQAKKSWVRIKLSH